MTAIDVMAVPDGPGMSLILFRAGDTELDVSGRFANANGAELSGAGVAQMAAAQTKLMGEWPIFKRGHLVKVILSPGKRAAQSLEHVLPQSSEIIDPAAIIVSDDLAEWNYGDYAGLTEEEIRALRRDKGLDQGRLWSILSDGCEGGESSQQVAARLDKLIAQIKRIHRPCIRKRIHGDILVVADGLILECLHRRWFRTALDKYPLTTMLPPGAVDVFGYNWNILSSPTIFDSKWSRR